MNKAIFLDKDGTLIENIPYNADPAKLTLVPDAIEALQLLQDAGYKFVVISNQSGIARGMFGENDIKIVKHKLETILAKNDIDLTDFYYCPHHPDGKVTQYAVSCPCRKPEPGLFFQAAQEYDINLEQSWMIGDILHDIEAGNRAGCKTVLIDNGNETEWEISPTRTPAYIVNNLKQAAQAILKLENEDKQKQQYNNLTI